MRLMKLGLMAALLTLTAACSTVGNLSVRDRDETPRTAAVGVSVEITAALDEVALLCEAGGIPPTVATTIVRHAPAVIDVAEQYFESAEPCVVIDGALMDDPAAAGKNCQRGSIQKVSKQFPSVLAEAAGQFGLGTQTGLALYLAGRAVDEWSGRNDGGFIDGFQKDDELSLVQYKAALAPLRDARDRASVCVTKAAAAQVAETTS